MERHKSGGCPGYLGSKTKAGWAEGMGKRVGEEWTR